jgi:hypothetical protein
VHHPGARSALSVEFIPGGRGEEEAELYSAEARRRTRSVHSTRKEADDLDENVCARGRAYLAPDPSEGARRVFEGEVKVVLAFGVGLHVRYRTCRPRIRI